MDRIEKLKRKRMGNYNHYLEDGVMWYCLDMGKAWYLSLSINQKINFKNSYFYLGDPSIKILYGDGFF